MVTAVIAGVLGLIYFKLSLDTIAARRRNQVSLGYGKNEEIMQIVSAHQNFSAYIPFLLILLYIVETTNLLPWFVLLLLGLIFTAGRVLHFIAFKEKMNFKFRILGMHFTLWPLLILSILSVVTAFI